MSFSESGDFLWGTYLGGPLLDVAHDVAYHAPSDHAIIAGMTRSQDGIASQGAFQTTFAGGLYDSFMARLCVPVATTVDALDGTDLCGDGLLRFALAPPPSSATWYNGDENPVLSLQNAFAGMQQVSALYVDTTGCPGHSDTLSVGFHEDFSPHIGLSVSPDTSNCLGAAYHFSVDSEFDNLLWWDGTSQPAAEFLPTDTLPYWIKVTVFDVNGCSAEDSVLIQSQICVSVNAVDGDGAVLIPNPSNGAVMLSWKNSGTQVFNMEVFSLDGRKMEQGRIQANVPFSLPLPSGAYVLRVSSMNGEFHHHFRHLIR